MNIAPEVTSTILSNKFIIEDFPDPVLPMIPRLVPALIVKLTFYNANLVAFGYCK
jgi:hypothetical protein